MAIGAEALREECGVFGIFGHPDAARLAVLGLHALQHRGQEGAGVCAADGAGLRVHRGLGLVREVFGGREVESLTGTAAIGHVRYSTWGGNSIANVQPLMARVRDAEVAVSHNGNFVNAGALRAELAQRGSLFAGTADTELVLHLMALSGGSSLVNRLIEAMYQLQGAASLLVLSADRLIALRDPHGFRPLVLGRLGEAWVVASETCALDLVGAQLEREIEPGELLVIDASGAESVRPFPPVQRQACVFEHIYFARPDSEVFGRSVYAVRRTLGRVLAEEHPADADVVVPVPDSGVPAALGYAERSGLPMHFGLLRSHYKGRTFIEPDQASRDLGVKLKLSPVRSVLEGRRVVVVDDSLVRGTTSQKIVAMLRSAGAREVHLRISAPPTIASCHYGVDTPTREELIAHRLELPAIRAFLGADSLGYLSPAGLRAVQGDDAGRYCEACFTGRYPVRPGADPADAQLRLFRST